MQDVATFKMVLENAEAPVAWSLKGDVPGFITIVESTGTLIVDAAGTNFNAADMERVVTVAAKEGERDPVEAQVRCVVKPDQSWELGLERAIKFYGGFEGPDTNPDGKWMMQVVWDGRISEGQRESLYLLKNKEKQTPAQLGDWSIYAKDTSGMWVKYDGELVGFSQYREYAVVEFVYNPELPREVRLVTATGGGTGWLELELDYVRIGTIEHTYSTEERQYGEGYKFTGPENFGVKAEAA